MTAPAADGNLEPIDAVARRLGLRASAIRYYEARGLLTPASRHAGRRWYGPTEIRRLAMIQYWQRYGLMSLDEIREILAGPAAGRQWGQVMRDRIDSLRAQIEHMEATREWLEHVLGHHPDSAPDGCRHFEAVLFGRPHRGAGSARAGGGVA
jgi:MerR family transcriptional regulator, copper efflux regulator